MKKSIIILIIAFINISSGFAQDWQTDFSKAKELATKEKKPIILVFQGSDWCAPCIKLSREIWTTETFIAYAKDNYIMFQADFPRKRKMLCQKNRLQPTRNWRRNMIKKEYSHW
ncbi:thioredoxin family protein [Cyclobacterium qasimii]|uniref:Thioredoxin Disulfide Isomerase n=1 Tax=Cyclobacterium qasimii M12-11B TaxID=641524 RepID=S7WZU6_9BACT|nr:Thioredoxin Disulfide Isomerase [Cyclobacterium qasimii M12-11B]